MGQGGKIPQVVYQGRSWLGCVREKGVLFYETE